VGVPGFLLRKLYKRGSLTALDDERFTFTIQNTLGTATLVSPPDITVNGIHHPAADVDAGPIDLAKLSWSHPYVFKRGTEIELRLVGRLMRSNRIHIRIDTKEFDDIDFLVEDHLFHGKDEEE